MIEIRDGVPYYYVRTDVGHVRIPVPTIKLAIELNRTHDDNGAIKRFGQHLADEGKLVEFINQAQEGESNE